eukprot:GFUD01014712.1.p1 GENE.GFUD01014712.1~~GFUD01014712.1.p1  ORF type:complete len:623 (-),score=143.22 GFUD01014712.1:40-1908(-)
MINPEDNCSVGESVKMRGRWLAEEQRRRADEQLRLLKEEESRIAKMKAKLDRRKRKDERRKKDRERMEQGNRELNMNREMFTGEESFLDIQPVNCSTQKTVMFNKELTKIRNISPVGSENLIEIVDKIENDRNEHGQNCSGNGNSTSCRQDNEILNKSSDSEKVVEKKNLFPCTVESQQVFLPTQHIPQSKRKIKKSFKFRGDERRILSSSLSIGEFDAKLAVECLLFSEKLSPCEFSLPKEYTSLKLEKMRENTILSQSLYIPSQSLLNKSQKRKRQVSENESQLSPKRKVKSCQMTRKRLERTQYKGAKKKISPAIPENGEVVNALFEKCSDGRFSVIVCISATDINVWVCSLAVGNTWVKVGQFSLVKKLLSPFVVVDSDTIRVKSFWLENNQLKEISFVILGDKGDFTDAVTSTQNVLVLTESIHIDSFVVEKYDSKQVILFHNLDRYSRGTVVSYHEDQMEVKFLKTLKGTTEAVKKLSGTEKICLSFMSNVLYFWDIKCGICVKTLAIDDVSIDPHTILNVVYVRGLINVFHCIDGELKISVLRKRSFKELATYFLEEDITHNFDSNSCSLFYMNHENVCLFLGNLCFRWKLKDKFVKCDKMSHSEDFHLFLPFMS